MTTPTSAAAPVSSGRGRTRYRGGRRIVAVEITELGVERECNRCHEWWPLDGDFFARQVNGFLGFQGICKACHADGRAA